LKYRKSGPTSIENNTLQNFNKANSALYDSVSSPEKSNNEKLEVSNSSNENRNGLMNDNKNYANPDKNNLKLHSLKKRSSMKERYNSFRNNRGNMGSAHGVIRSNELDTHGDDASGINLPMVKRDSKTMPQHNDKIDSCTKLETIHNKELGNSLTGLPKTGRLYRK